MEVSLITSSPPFLDSTVTWSLTLAHTFDYLLGRPSYGYSQETREVFLARVRCASAFANDRRRPGDPIDIELSPDMAAVPHVPSWNRSKIEELRAKEVRDPWACENALLEDEMAASQNLGRALEKSEQYAELGYAPHPSGRGFV